MRLSPSPSSSSSPPPRPGCGFLFVQSLFCWSNVGESQGQARLRTGLGLCRWGLDQVGERWDVAPCSLQPRLPFTRPGCVLWLNQRPKCLWQVTQPFHSLILSSSRVLPLINLPTPFISNETGNRCSKRLRCLEASPGLSFPEGGTENRPSWLYLQQSPSSPVSAGGQLFYERIFWKGTIYNLNCQKIKSTKLLFFTAIILVWSGLCCLCKWSTLALQDCGSTVRQGESQPLIMYLSWLCFLFLPCYQLLHFHNLSRKQITKLVKPGLSVLDELCKWVQGKIRLRLMKYIGFWQ